jgi:excisionase family DNA binding protein
MATARQPSLPFGQPPPPQTRLERLLSAQELADYLDVPLKTIYAWRYRGQGPRGFRVGRHVRFRLSDVHHWVSDQLDKDSLGGTHGS